VSGGRFRGCAVVAAAADGGAGGVDHDEIIFIQYDYFVQTLLAGN